MLRDNIRPYLPRIISRELTNRDVAALLKVSEYTVCRVLKQLKIKRDPAPDRAAHKALLRQRKEVRENAAKTLSIKAAAAAANCSTRTIYRLRKKD